MIQPTFQQYQHQFTDYVRDPKQSPRPNGVQSRRMRIYADIVFNNMDDTLSACFPVCKKIIGARRWNRLVRTFMAEHQCTTPFFRKIPEELLRWLESSPQATHDLPQFILSLAHYEWVELAVAVSDASLDDIPDADGDLLIGQPVLAPALVLLRYDYPVHQISQRFKPSQPLELPVNLLVFRDTDDAVQFVELNPVSARLIELLQSNQFTGQQVIEKVAAEIQFNDLSVIVEFGTELLKDLHHKGAILGAVNHKKTNKSQLL